MTKSKKITLLVVGLILVIIFVGASVYFLRKPRLQATPDNLAIINSPPVKLEVNPDATYEDDAGFSFSHPEILEVNDTTPEDDETYYTQITALKNGQELVISAYDTKQKDVESWLKNSSEAPQNTELYGATTLGDLKATQYIDTDSLYTIVIDKQVLYLIKGPKDEFWEKVQNLIASTWIFEGVETKKTPVNTSPNIIYEAEEVIE